MSSLNKSMLPSFSASLAIFLARISRITRIFFGEGFRGQGFLVTLVGINDFFFFLARISRITRMRDDNRGEG